MSMRKPPRTIVPARWILLPGMLVALLLVPPLSNAQTQVFPGATVTLGPFDYSNCDTQRDELHYIFQKEHRTSGNYPQVKCEITNLANGAFKVRAGTGLWILNVLSEVVLAEGEDQIRYGFAIGRIGKTIRIPSPDVDEIGAEVLTAQISTDIDWAGLLWNRRLLIPSWTQVVGTLQVRDLTTGLVVASNTFLNERADLEHNVPNFGSLLKFFSGWTTVHNSSGVDLTAKLLRGRDYRIEVEAKCEDLSALPPILPPLYLHGGGCFFSDDTADRLFISPGIIFENGDETLWDVKGGFHVSPLTVTVQDDAKAKLAEALANDSDGDGVPDFHDACLDSDLSPTVMINECDSGVTNHLLENGCTISDEIAKCAVGAKNHGEFVSCVADLTNTLKKDEIITGNEKGQIQSCAAKAD